MWLLPRKVLTVHSVRASKTVLDLVEENLPAGTGKVVLHWFTGSKSEARRAAELGCYFSVNSQMMRNEKGRELIGSLPLDRLLTETDGPFTQVNGRPASPSDIGHTVEALATLYRKTPAEIGALVRDNLKIVISSP
jgi:TatD DNase family protein